MHHHRYCTSTAPHPPHCRTCHRDQSALAHTVQPAAVRAVPASKQARKQAPHVRHGPNPSAVQQQRSPPRPAPSRPIPRPHPPCKRAVQHPGAAGDGGERGAEADEAARGALKHEALLALGLQGHHLGQLGAGVRGGGAQGGGGGGGGGGAGGACVEEGVGRAGGQEKFNDGARKAGWCEAVKVISLAVPPPPSPPCPARPHSLIAPHLSLAQREHLDHFPRVSLLHLAHHLLQRLQALACSSSGSVPRLCDPLVPSSLPPCLRTAHHHHPHPHPHPHPSRPP